jgi:hypothetical protein
MPRDLELASVSSLVLAKIDEGHLQSASIFEQAFSSPLLCPFIRLGCNIELSDREKAV